MESIKLVGPRPRRLARPPDTPTAAELAARAQRAIDDIDQRVGRRTACACVVCGAGLPYPAATCPRCTRAEHRSAPPDERPVGVPVEYAAGGRILGIR